MKECKYHGTTKNIINTRLADGEVHALCGEYYYGEGGGVCLTPMTDTDTPSGLSAGYFHDAA